jgi:hypothetical protein
MPKPSKKHYSPAEYDKQYAIWKKAAWKTELPRIKALAASTLTKCVRADLAQLQSMSSSDYELLRKWYELQDFRGKYSDERLDEVYKRIWQASGYSDFRRIEPELIHIKECITARKVNIWGEITEREYPILDPLAENWDILRTLVSRHRNAGVIGKQHRYLVRDKGTKKYLGVICISSDMLQPAGREQIIGWTEAQKLKMLYHCANGSTIVPLSPFAGAFNGGKLLSLLCLSDLVAENWQDDVGKDKKHYRLVHVLTTSLYGNEDKGTMYDNLEPYWTRTPAETSGNTALEISPENEKACLNWLFVNEPRIFYDHFRAKKKDGTPKIRDPKDKAMKKVFSLLGIKPAEYMSGHKRGMYLAPLYENTYEFLRGEIDEAALIPKFDNSVEALSHVWKFGLTAANSGAKARLDLLLKVREKKLKKKKPVKPLPTTKKPFWYRDMMNMSWEEAKKVYGASDVEIPPNTAQEFQDSPAVSEA